MSEEFVQMNRADYDDLKKIEAQFNWTYKVPPTDLIKIAGQIMHQVSRFEYTLNELSLKKLSEDEKRKLVSCKQNLDDCLRELSHCELSIKRSMYYDGAEVNND